MDSVWLVGAADPMTASKTFSADRTSRSKKQEGVQGEAPVRLHSGPRAGGPVPEHHVLAEVVRGAHPSVHVGEQEAARRPVRRERGGGDDRWRDGAGNLSCLQRRLRDFDIRRRGVMGEEQVRRGAGGRGETRVMESALV